MVTKIDHSKLNSQFLTISNHTREFENYTYVYPVISRRAQGVSLGINLNINNSCNWRCIYCQVKGLIRGKPPAINLKILEQELISILESINSGQFYLKYVPPNMRRFNDICLSGNGESTLSPDFINVCQLITKLRAKYSLADQVKTILITNGSELHHLSIQEGIKIIANNNGEVWFKIDRASPDAIKQVNQVNLSISKIVDHLAISSALCPTYIQSCWFSIEDCEPDLQTITDFLLLLKKVQPLIKGVLLYSTARNPALPEGYNISSVSEAFMADLHKQVAALGIKVNSYC